MARKKRAKRMVEHVHGYMKHIPGDGEEHVKGYRRSEPKHHDGFAKRRHRAKRRKVY